jgi:hypothetical protein
MGTGEPGQAGADDRDVGHCSGMRWCDMATVYPVADSDYIDLVIFNCHR